VLEDGLVGFVSSALDRFLNHLFATGVPALGEVDTALEGRPGFVWLCDDAAVEAARTGAGSQPVLLMHGMRTSIQVSRMDERTPASITPVTSFDDLADWHAVYRSVFGADPRSLDEWRRIHLALGPTGNNSLVLHLVRVDGSSAATAAAFFDRDAVGLYCFTTCASMRGRGIASALIRASHAAASARGIEQALLHATPAGRPVYARAGYLEERVLPVLALP
jgi:GNAT superfamily N-acetyltransferase